MTTPPRALSHPTRTNESSTPVKSTNTEHQAPADASGVDRRGRKTASTITDPELDALYDQRDALLRRLASVRGAGAAA